MLLKDILIDKSASIKKALKRLDKTAVKALLVVDKNNKLLGAISDGDIRRHILKGKDLESDISEIYNKSPIYIRKEELSMESVKKLLIRYKIELIPVLDNEHKVVEYITWDQLFPESEQPPFKKSRIDIPVVIMAGGKGSRLEPFTKILPKALIPVGDKPIIEMIIDEFKQQGVEKFYLTLNHKSEMIKAYFKGIEKEYKVNYIKEKTFLGTAGSLKLLENKISDTFIVSNCDIIVKANFENVLALHQEQKASLTILSSVQHYEIPYGVINLKEGGEVANILEKPEYTFTINTGVYVLNKDTLDFIPADSHMDMTELIKILAKNGKKILTYPVNEKEYLDIGQWKEYKKVLQYFREQETK